MRKSHSVPSRAWQWAALACASAASVGLLILPTGSGQSVAVDSAGNVTDSGVTHYTLLQSDGRSILLVLAVPVVLALIPLLTPANWRQRVSLVATGLLGIGVLLAMLSVGVFFVPALGCAIFAVALARNADLTQAVPSPTS